MNKNIIIKTEDIAYYLKDIKKIPVITYERQEYIFKSLLDENVSNEIKEKLKSELVVGNLRFVITVAKLYQNQGLDLIDLISEGNIGLLKAIEKFNFNCGLKFISYAVWWVKQSILSALNDYSRTIRIPSNLVHISQKQKKFNRENNDENILEDDLMYGLPSCRSLFDVISEGSKYELIDTIRDPNEVSPDHDILHSDIEIKDKVFKMLCILDKREKIIIEKYFGLTGIESNLDDLGEEFKCTKERIRQIKDKAIKKLRNESYSLLKYL